jgi:membrane-bound lytic murein transglycosylase F
MIKRKQIGIISALLVLFFCVFLLLYNKKKTVHDLPAILESNRLSVIIDSSRIGFSKNGDKVVGFQYEIVKAFADSLGLELVVSQQNDLRNGINGLQRGDFDIIASFIPNITDLQKELLFSHPFFISRQVLVQRINNDIVTKEFVIQPINKQLMLAKDTIFIPSHSPFKMRLEHLSNEIADTIFCVELKNKSQEQMVQLVANGSIKYTICDAKLARILCMKYPNIDVSLPIGFSHQLCWGVSPKSVQLLDKLNVFLIGFIGSSDYWEIYRKYY